MSLLWFRRGRKADAKPDAPPEPELPPAAPHQERAPLAIRGLLLLNLRADEGLEQIESAPPLGPRGAVIETIRAAIPAIRFEAERGTIAAADHTVTIDLGREDPVAAAVVAATGDEGIEGVIALLRRTNWRAYAPRQGVFIEPESLDLFALPDARRDLP